MNFRDVETCEPCLAGPACPTPVSGSTMCQDDCQPVPASNGLETPLSSEARSAERFEELPALDQMSPSPVNNRQLWQQRSVSSKSAGGPATTDGPMARFDTGSDQLVLNPPSQTPDSQETVARPANSHRDYIFENAVFQHSPQPQQHDNRARVAIQPSNQAAEIVIHPPMIQPYNQHQHTFVIENQGQVDAAELAIEISVPEGVKIVAALPTNSVTTPRAVVFKFDKLLAGDQAAVHVTAISTERQAIPFEVSVVSRSERSFRVHDEAVAGVLKNVSYEGGPVAAPSRAQAIPGDDANGGPVLVRNPYFQNAPQNHEATRRRNRR